MENKESKKLPDIDFGSASKAMQMPKRAPSQHNGRPAQGSAGKSSAERPRRPMNNRPDANEHPVHKKRPAPNADAPKQEKVKTAETPVNEQDEAAVRVANERITKHEAMLDKAFSEIEEEKSEEAAKAEEKSAEPIIDSEEEITDKPVENDEKKASPLEFHNDYSSPERKPGGKKKKKKKSKKKKRVRFNGSIVGGLTITIVVISLSIVLATSAISLGMEYLGINKTANEITFNIPEGSNNDEIADILVSKNIITNKDLFKAALKIKKPAALYPGDITLRPNMSYPDIIENLATMRESYETVSVTIPEGATLLQVAKKLEKKGVCSADDFLFQFNADLDMDVDKKITHSSDAYYAMEGYFFPDTYEFYVGDSAFNVTQTVREHFASKITDDMYKRMDELGMDLNEVITLASIVQWESGSVEDMPRVASVFINRLNDPDTFPTLQSDATKNYVKKVIKKVETSTAMIDHYTNCYDTYVCMGLPAGPVCNPGLDAINAVLYHEDTDYYYFCNNLETGESFFAETYKQHKKNLKKAGLSE